VSTFGAMGSGSGMGMWVLFVILILVAIGGFMWVKKRKVVARLGNLRIRLPQFGRMVKSVRRM